MFGIMVTFGLCAIGYVAGFGIGITLSSLLGFY